MQLTLFSIKRCWPSSVSPSGFATDGGFPIQVAALSELFDATVLVVPCLRGKPDGAESPLVGHNLTVVSLSYPPGRGVWRKVAFPIWLTGNCRRLWRAIHTAEAVHAPIPGDVGTIGFVLALLYRKPLFVRHCGNWLAPKTLAERTWKWLMQEVAGGRNVMLATGGGDKPPSSNTEVRWIFSSSLTEQELRQCAIPKTIPADGKTRLIIVARQTKAKGTGLLIQALPLIAQKFPGVALDIVGEGADLGEFKREAVTLGLDDRVRFHGGQPHGEVLRLLQRAHLFCFPTSSSDGFPKAVLEGLACGLPIIATPVSVLPKLLEAGCGRLVADPNPATIAAAIAECFRDPVRYQDMSLAALGVARQYSLEKWRDTIGETLANAWGPLRTNPGSR